MPGVGSLPVPAVQSGHPLNHPDLWFAPGMTGPFHTEVSMGAGRQAGQPPPTPAQLLTDMTWSVDQLPETARLEVVSEGPGEDDG